MRLVGAGLFRADGHAEAHGRFSQFFQRTWKTINEIRLGAARKFHEYIGKRPVSFQTEVMWSVIPHRQDTRFLTCHTLTFASTFAIDVGNNLADTGKPYILTVRETAGNDILRHFICQYNNTKVNDLNSFLENYS